MVWCEINVLTLSKERINYIQYADKVLTKRLSLGKKKEKTKRKDSRLTPCPDYTNTVALETDRNDQDAFSVTRLSLTNGPFVYPIIQSLNE